MLISKGTGDFGGYQDFSQKTAKCALKYRYIMRYVHLEMFRVIHTLGDSTN